MITHTYHNFYLSNPPEQYFENPTFTEAERKADELLNELLKNDEDV